MNASIERSVVWAPIIVESVVDIALGGSVVGVVASVVDVVVDVFCSEYVENIIAIGSVVVVGA